MHCLTECFERLEMSSKQLLLPLSCSTGHFVSKVSRGSEQTLTNETPTETQSRFGTGEAVEAQRKTKIISDRFELWCGLF